jgi:hypothetical protein
MLFLQGDITMTTFLSITAALAVLAAGALCAAAVPVYFALACGKATKKHRHRPF